MAANRNQRRNGVFPAADILIEDGWRGDDFRSSGNDDDADFNDEENPFDSIGRALDHCEEIGVVRTGARQHTDSKNQFSVEESSSSCELPMAASDNAVDNYSSMTVSKSLHHTQENEQNRSHPTHDSATNENCQQQLESSISTSSKNAPTRSNNVTQLSHVSTQRKVSPHRFTFQTSAKPKFTSLKTPSRRSLPKEDLFSSSAITQRVTANRSARKSVSNESTKTRNRRHTFRISTDRSPISAVENNVREMRFIPSFLSNTKVGSANAHEDVPGENDVDAYHPHDETSPFAHNILLDYHRQQQMSQSHRKSEQKGGKSGYLVRRLRSLRNADQRMAVRGHNYTSGSNDVSTPRKRRRSGSGEYFHPRSSASTSMDVTVSGALQSVCKFDEGKTVLFAYIHCYTYPSHYSEDQCDRLSFPCYALILMSRDLVQELGITTSQSKQLRIYDGVLIPPRFLALDRNVASENGKPDRDFHSYDMPIIICTHICEENPGSVPLPDVPFPPPSRKM